MTHRMTLVIDQFGNYEFKKGGTTPVHKKGHICLLNESQPVDVEITLDPKTVALGYAFAPGPAGSSGVNAFFIAPVGANKNAFNGWGQFSNLTLSSAGAKLTFRSKNDDGNAYDYQLNFAPVAGLRASIDPILINRC